MILASGFYNQTVRPLEGPWQRRKLWNDERSTYQSLWVISNRLPMGATSRLVLRSWRRCSGAIRASPHVNRPAGFCTTRSWESSPLRISVLVPKVRPMLLN